MRYTPSPSPPAVPPIALGSLFLAWYFRTPLYKEDSLWSSGPSTYLSNAPLNYRQDNREIDVFRGFGYRLGWVCNRLCVWIKLTHRYAESSWLLEGYSLDDIQQKLRMRHFLYYYGHRWFPVQLLGLTGKSIAEQCFIPDGSRDPISVYDWTLREASGDHPPPWIQSLDHHSPAIAYRYPSNEKKRSGAAALCKLLVQTEDERVGAVHRMSIVDPQASSPNFGRWRRLTWHEPPSGIHRSAYDPRPFRWSQRCSPCRRRNSARARRSA